MSFHAPLRPRKIDKTINYFIYEFHSNRNTCPTETEFLTCYLSSCLAGKDLPPWKR